MRTHSDWLLGVGNPEPLPPEEVLKNERIERLIACFMVALGSGHGVSYHTALGFTGEEWEAYKMAVQRFNSR